MKHNPHHMMVRLILIIVGIVSFQNVFAGTWNVSVRQSDTIDYCGNGEVILEVVVDQPVYFADSIYGFDFDIEYNPDKFSFYQVLEPGTLYGKVNNADGGLKFTNYSAKGVIQVSFSSNQRPIAGTNVLVRILGKLKRDCADTSYTFLPFFEVDKEFSKKHYFYWVEKPFGYRFDVTSRLASLKPLSFSRTITSDRIDTVEREVKFVLNLKNTDSKREKLIRSTITLPQEIAPYIDSIFVGDISGEAKVQSSNYNSVGLTSDIILPTTTNENTIEFVCSLKNSIAEQDSIDIVVHNTVDEISGCTCTQLSKSDTLVFKWRNPKDSVPNSVYFENELERGKVEQVGDNFYVITEGLKGAVKLYNIFGESVESFVPTAGRHQILQNIENGCFFVVFESDNGKGVKDKYRVVKIIK